MQVLLIKAATSSVRVEGGADLSQTLADGGDGGEAPGEVLTASRGRKMEQSQLWVQGLEACAYPPATPTRLRK